MVEEEEEEEEVTEVGLLAVVVVAGVDVGLDGVACDLALRLTKLFSTDWIPGLFTSIASDGAPVEGGTLMEGAAFWPADAAAICIVGPSLPCWRFLAPDFPARATGAVTVVDTGVEDNAAESTGGGLSAAICGLEVPRAMDCVCFVTFLFMVIKLGSEVQRSDSDRPSGFLRLSWTRGSSKATGGGVRPGGRSKPVLLLDTWGAVAAPTSV